MRRAGHMLLGLCFALLILLGGQALVEGPVMAEVPPVQSFPPPLHACLTVPEEASAVAEDGLLGGQQHTLRRCAVREESRAIAPVPTLVCDRNGWPMTGRSYVRVAYTACPLEDMPG